MIRKTIFAIFMTMFLTIPALAGSGTSTIYGAVNDNGAALIGAKITIIGEATYTSRSTVTNGKGIYFFTKLPADEYIIQAIPMPAGIYKDGSANVFVGKGKEKEVNFSLKKK